MAGTAETPGQMVSVGGASSVHPSKVNSNRISVLMDRLLSHAGGTIKDDLEFLNLCLSLSRGIDYALVHYEVPSRVQELPSLLNQVCRPKNDALLHSAVMVLMISVKNACERGWFSNKDSDELINLTKELSSNFCGSSNFDTKATCSLSVTSTVMSRYYPRMRMGDKLVFLEVKPGFAAYLNGFQISKNLKPSPGQKVRLFVVQSDSITTSSCLTTPSKVNFLVNGKGVEKRTTISVDTGPQIPTDVTHMLKYGSNLLQAVGEFNGNYTIALALMSEMPNLESSTLRDYEQHVLPSVDSDSEIIEGPSRISLNCPISFKRIKIPVKGYSCKHIQCYDFNNYVDINSRVPSWRCPHCNQHVCFTDLRIDRKMVKILEEVGTHDSEVILASDGSWNVVIGTGGSSQKSVDKISNNAEDELPQSESFPLSKAPVDVLDLTAIDDSICSISDDEIQDMILDPSYLCQAETPTVAVDPRKTDTKDANQSSVFLDDDFWSGFVMPNFGLVSSESNTPIYDASATTSNNIAQTPVLAHQIGPNAPNQELETVNVDALVTASVLQTETSLSTMSFQQHQFGNSAVTEEYGRFPSLPRNVTKTPAAVQVLPAQTPDSVLQKRPRNSGNTFTQSSLPAASQNSPRAQMIPNSTHMSPFYASQRFLSPLHQYTGMQRNHSFPSVRSSQPSVPDQGRNSSSVERRSSTPPHLLRQPSISDQGRNSSSISNERRSSAPPHLVGQPSVKDQGRNSLSASNESHKATPPHLAGLRMQSFAESPTNFSRPQSQIGVSWNRTNLPSGPLTSQQAGMASSLHASGQMARPVEASRTHSYTTSISPDMTSSQGQTIAAIDPADQSWRPQSRMRGALSGQAYTDALNQYIIQPNQQNQAARPSPPSNVPPHLQSLIANTTATLPPGPGNSSEVPVAGPQFQELPDISSGTR